MLISKPFVCTLVLLFFCFLLHITNCKAQENEIVGNVGRDNVCEKTIKRMINKIQTKLKNDFDPLNIQHMDINATNSIVEMVGYLDTVQIKQLSNFNATDISCDMGLKSEKANLTLVFNSINITGLYDLNGFIINVIPVWGNGNFTIDLTDLIISVEATISSAHFDLTALEVQVTLGLMKTNFDKMMGGGYYQDMYNRMISDLVPKGVDFYWALYESTIDKILMNFINNKILSV